MLKNLILTDIYISSVNICERTMFVIWKGHYFPNYFTKEIDFGPNYYEREMNNHSPVRSITCFFNHLIMIFVFWFWMTNVCIYVIEKLKKKISSMHIYLPLTDGELGTAFTAFNLLVDLGGSFSKSDSLEDSVALRRIFWISAFFSTIILDIKFSRCCWFLMHFFKSCNKSLIISNTYWVTKIIQNTFLFTNGIPEKHTARKVYFRCKEQKYFIGI